MVSDCGIQSGAEQPIDCFDSAIVGTRIRLANWHRNDLVQLCRSRRWSSSALKVNLRFRRCLDDNYGVASYSWQVDIGAELIKKATLVKCSPHLLIWPTGGGRSCVRDAVGAHLNGITLTIVPLLSLGSNQYRKTIEKSCSKYLTSFHLCVWVTVAGVTNPAPFSRT